MKKCINRRCSFPLGDNYKYCPMCGKIQERQKEVKRRRAKGTGSIYFRKDKKTKPWCASINSDRKTEYIGCFATRAEAEAAILTYKPGQKSVPTLEKLYDYKGVSLVGENIRLTVSYYPGINVYKDRRSIDFTVKDYKFT